jgi:hypothetical protein
MAQIKISELIPKDAPLSTTDLLMISQSTPDGFESKSITGAEIITSAQEGRQATLISGTNIKTVNSTSLLGSGNIALSTNPRTLESVNGLNLTGTTNQISASVLIPAGTLVTNNTIYIKSLLTKSAGTTASSGRIYINTSNSLSGATLLATANSMNSTNYHQRFERNIFFDGTNLNMYNSSGGASFDLGNSIITLVPFNPATAYYLIFAVQNSTTTPDNQGHKRVIVQIYD